MGHPVCKLSIPEDTPFRWKESNTLAEILDEVQSKLSSYDQVWSVLEDIDKHCVVIDPSKPTFQHFHRRIYLRMIISIY